MTDIFDTQAIEAAERAVDKHMGRECGNHLLKIAIKAAEASLRERGKLTEGKHMALSKNGAGNMDLGNLEFWRGDFKFIVIRIGEP